MRSREKGEKEVTPKKIKAKMKTRVETEEKVDKEIAGVLMNLGTSSTSLVKLSAQGGKVTSIKKMKMRSQPISEPQIQILEKKQTQSKETIGEFMEGRIQVLKT